MNADTLQRFIFEDHQVRGEFVRLRASFQAAQAKYEYPPVVAEQLGQGLAASVLLGATIKFKGALIIQVQSSGPLTMLVAQCTDLGHVRGLARWQGDVPEGAVEDIYGEGSVAITVNTCNYQDRYQGIVSLEGQSLANALENYFLQSEQLSTRLFLFADRYHAVGLLLQRMPGEAAEDDLWDRVNILSDTLMANELLNLSNEEILHRLFYEEDIRLFDDEPISFRCTCSREKIEAMIVSLGHDEARAIIADQGGIHVGCEFCNHQYTFDAVDVEQIFSTELNPPSPDALQ